MANNPKRMQDPTEAAMSAIQEALNLREDAAAPACSRASRAARRPDRAERSAGPPSRRRRADAQRAPIDEDLFLQQTVGRVDEPLRAAPQAYRRAARSVTRRRRRSSSTSVKPTQRAANDDRQSVGQVLQPMQRRPSRAPYMAAFFLSGRLGRARHLGRRVAYFGGDFRAMTQPGRRIRPCSRSPPASCCRCCCSTCSRT